MGHEIVHATRETELWQSVANTYRTDGAISEQFVSNRDGSRIRSQFDAAGGDAAWDERHTILLADGSKLVIENTGLTQTIYDAHGQRLSETVMTANGPEAQPVAQPASLSVIGRAVASAPRLLQGATILYNWLSSQNSRDSTAILAFRANVYKPVVGAVGATIWTGTLTETELRNACPSSGDVQRHTNIAASTVVRSDYSSPSAYGTAVHTSLRRIVDGLDNPNLRAEVSLLKTLHETGQSPLKQQTDYGTKGSVRIDVLENTRARTVCVYDIKTGESGLYPGRSAEIASAVYLRFPTARRIIVIEVRPHE